MTFRERILAVYQDTRPDVAPAMLDLSHWFYHHHQTPWDLTRAQPEPELDLIACHRHHGVGFYLPQIPVFYTAAYPSDVSVTATKHQAGGQPEIRWRIESRHGAIERARRWEPATYAWGVSQWGIHTADDLRILADALSRRTYQPAWHNFTAWDEAVGDLGVIYMPLGYSAMGHLLNYWMGIETTIYATLDFPDALAEAVDAINANQLHLVDLLCESPADIILMGDNISADVQPPSFFNRWSRPFYVEAIRRLHAAGKYVAVHVDGRLRGAIAMIRDTGADAADAITPAPIGDLDAAACRAEAGDRFILSGGVSPELWLPTTPLASFDAHVIAWLEQRHRTHRFLAAAGDQVPPGADPARFTRFRELVDAHGRFPSTAPHPTQDCAP